MMVPLSLCSNVQQINEDDSLTFSNNVISVTDPDAAEVEDLLEVTVSALFGTSPFHNDGSLVFTQDTSGPTGSTMSFKGTEANLNNALDELVYTPSADHNDLCWL